METTDLNRRAAAIPQTPHDPGPATGHVVRQDMAPRRPEDREETGAQMRKQPAPAKSGGCERRCAARPQSVIAAIRDPSPSMPCLLEDGARATAAATGTTAAFRLTRRQASVEHRSRAALAADQRADRVRPAREESHRRIDAALRAVGRDRLPHADRIHVLHEERHRLAQLGGHDHRQHRGGHEDGERDEQASQSNHDLRADHCPAGPEGVLGRGGNDGANQRAMQPFRTRGRHRAFALVRGAARRTM
jgi:hypothetical protein